MKNFNTIEFIESFISYGERQGEKEKEAANLILEILEENSIKFVLQEFKIEIPLTLKSFLIADKKKIPCMGTSFVSGEIKGKENIISSLFFSNNFIQDSNINFNPCSEFISRSSHYFRPSLAIAKSEMFNILEAEEVIGEVEVEKYKHVSKNILVGNLESPQNIIFAHYDSIGLGATDNASGVATLLSTIINDIELLKNSLFVFSGCEELSYEKPYYWGYGFRVFEKEFLNQLKAAYKIIVVDCVGNGENQITCDKKIQELAFPIKNLDVFNKKVFIVHADMVKLMKVYHSEGDDILQLNEKRLKEAEELLIKNLI